MNQADDWEVRARNAEVNLTDAYDDIDDLMLEATQRQWEPWILRVEGVLAALIAVLLVVAL